MAYIMEPLPQRTGDDPAMLIAVTLIFPDSPTLRERRLATSAREDYDSTPWLARNSRASILDDGAFHYSMAYTLRESQQGLETLLIGDGSERQLLTPRLPWYPCD
jgi:hypothetical protein